MGNFYSCGEVAEMYGVTVLTVTNWIKAGKLSAIKPGRAYLIKPEALVAFEQKHTTQ